MRQTVRLPREGYIHALEWLANAWANVLSVTPWEVTRHYTEPERKRRVI